MTDQEVLSVISSCSRSVLPELIAHEFAATDRLADLGANSVDRAEIIVLVLEALSLDIPRTELFGPGNIGELAALLQKKLSR
jgi:polyketide biosynthesis acyl carrier protein